MSFSQSNSAFLFLVALLIAGIFLVAVPSSPEPKKVSFDVSDTLDSFSLTDADFDKK